MRTLDAIVQDQLGRLCYQIIQLIAQNEQLAAEIIAMREAAAQEVTRVDSSPD